MSKKKTIHVSGKRKRAVARTTVSDGTGRVTVNNAPLDLYDPVMYKMRIMEPLLLAGDLVKSLDIQVTVEGGGINSRADAIRLSIAKGLAEHSPKLKNVFAEYDRQLLVADVRRKEPRKPNTHGHARSKKQKSYR